MLLKYDASLWKHRWPVICTFMSVLDFWMTHQIDKLANLVHLQTEKEEEKELKWLEEVVNMPLSKAFKAMFHWHSRTTSERLFWQTSRCKNGPLYESEAWAQHNTEPGNEKSTVVLLVKWVIWGPAGRRCDLKELGRSHTRLDWLHQAELSQNHAGLALWIKLSNWSVLAWHKASYS